MPEVIIYTTAVCPYCVRAKWLLDKKGVKYTEIRVDSSMEKRREMVQRAHGRTSVPQIFIGDTHVGGFDDMYALEISGSLDGLLKGA